MRARRYILTGVAAVYFGALVGLAFLPAPGAERVLWVWPFVAFLPVGALLLAILGPRRWWASIAFVVLGAAWVEAAQSVWMPVGYAAGIDIVWASLGGALGVVVTFAAVTSRAKSMRVHGSPRIVAQAGRREIPQD